jgi:hypothetical protein
MQISNDDSISDDKFLDEEKLIKVMEATVLMFGRA